jgi:hypothetical protein
MESVGRNEVSSVRPLADPPRPFLRKTLAKAFLAAAGLDDADADAAPVDDDEDMALLAFCDALLNMEENMPAPVFGGAGEGCSDESLDCPASN